MRSIVHRVAINFPIELLFLPPSFSLFSSPTLSIPLSPVVWNTFQSRGQRTWHDMSECTEPEGLIDCRCGTESKKCFSRKVHSALHNCWSNNCVLNSPWLPFRSIPINSTLTNWSSGFSGFVLMPNVRRYHESVNVCLLIHFQTQNARSFWHAMCECYSRIYSLTAWTPAQNKSVEYKYERNILALCILSFFVTRTSEHPLEIHPVLSINKNVSFERTMI